jgi:nucleoside-diphosphate kinase
LAKKNSSQLSAKPIIAIEVIGKDAQQRLCDITVDAKEGKDNDKNSNGSRPSSRSGLSKSLRDDLIVSNSQRSANMELSYFFNGMNNNNTATFTNCTLAIIKPHAVQAGVAGQILSMINQNGYIISALQMFTLDRESSNELLEIYQGVVPDYSQMVEELSSGSCIAFELISSDNNKNNIVESFRQLCGPSDPEVGRHIRPNTIRAKFGQSRVQNAIHCTDLPEDGPLESEFFFSILQKIKC